MNKWDERDRLDRARDARNIIVTPWQLLALLLLAAIIGALLWNLLGGGAC